ncbi:hypothetical protein ILYODFUR_027660 [Ilyodon furcidens]|uniref:Uncharacterized protein n=1 Tax=Ilyodon furcidens TaxID=33524 RepID=A0ABV0V8J6_9TELE
MLQDCSHARRQHNKPLLSSKEEPRRRIHENPKPASFPSLVPTLILFWESSDQYHRQDCRARQEEAHLRSGPQQR